MHIPGGTTVITPYVGTHTPPLVASDCHIQLMHLAGGHLVPRHYIGTHTPPMAVFKARIAVFALPGGSYDSLHRRAHAASGGRVLVARGAHLPRRGPCHGCLINHTHIANCRLVPAASVWCILSEGPLPRLPTSTTAISRLADFYRLPVNDCSRRLQYYDSLYRQHLRHFRSSPTSGPSSCISRGCPCHTSVNRHVAIASGNLLAIV